MKARCAVSGSGSPNADNGFAEKRRSVYIKRGVPDSDISVNGTKTDLSPIRTVKRKFCFSLRNGSRQKTISGTAFRRAFFVLNAFLPCTNDKRRFLGRLLPHVLFCGRKKVFFETGCGFLRAFLSVGKRDGRFFYAMKTAAISAAEANDSNQNRAAEASDSNQNRTAE